MIKYFINASPWSERLLYSLAIQVNAVGSVSRKYLLVLFRLVPYLEVHATHQPGIIETTLCKWFAFVWYCEEYTVLGRKLLQITWHSRWHFLLTLKVASKFELLGR